MTNEDSLDLARRLVACNGFRWLPGMVAISARGLHGPARIESLEFPREHTVPNLSDPATQHLLLALVAEAYPRVSVTLFLRTPERCARVQAGADLFDADTEVEALVAALEAAR